ncbi:PREDICTED: molybdopterin synthase catalytic subunit-like [Amphimedon queenslandica]|uniref:Uncharacterized protein n=1 Tax=Amphimedon queenslandica TaxID=400682 RepID=A0A1X7UW74_AMPQE|nr:PREDICTED: molybdopterin synthase catalytic subunit-like [Amphimedon queenslandica]|eukprot:XP_019851826.1 PREDICTED: molybdopterin synthase catalytic subunit-like [Amphimedon queenslandica]
MGVPLITKMTTCLLPVTALVIDMMSEEIFLAKEDVQVEIELTEDEVIKTSRGTQCSATPSNGTDDKPVLIRASKEELMQRIDAFTRFKRKQIDVSNQLEFSRRTAATGDEGCARTDIEYHRRPNHVRQVKNSEGPNDSIPNLREELWAELILEGRDYPRPEIGSKNVLMLEERVQELEEALDCKGSSSTGTSLLQRIKSLETRVLLMEGTSTEYALLSRNK